MLFVGMRTLKTALAVTVSVYLAQLLGLNSPFFAGIAAIIALQGNLVDSFTMARDRMLGTILGGIFGFATAQIAHGNPLILGLGVALIIYVFNQLKWNKAIVIAAVVFTSMMLGFDACPTFSDALNRVVDTFLGITVAVVINFAISPRYSRDRVITTATGLVRNCRALLRRIVLHEGNLSLKDIAAELDILEAELPAFKKEVQLHIVQAQEGLDLDAMKGQLEELYRLIYLLAELPGETSLNQDNSRTVASMYGLEIPPGPEGSPENIVFNYHLARALILAESLSESFGLDIGRRSPGQAKGAEE